MDTLLVGRRLKTFQKPVGAQLFRVIPLSKRGENPQDFSYAPKPEYCSKGRCNNEGEQVFYGSTSIATCINELKGIKIGDCVRVGRWEMTAPLMYINYLTQDPESKTKEAKIFNVLAEFFSTEGNKYYEHTIMLTEMAFEAKLRLSQVSSEVSQINAIAYPSTLKTGKNPAPINMAIRKAFVDGHMKLLYCWHYEVTGISNDSYEVKKVASGDVTDGAIKWTRSEIFRGNAGADFTLEKDPEGWSIVDDEGVAVDNPKAQIDR
ncbi:hypothetical protein PsW64_04727 [Pseudovibrio sp. W64]|nr:hypothetical protein PsW64_04727 [Pseudovibrio sp. W64]